MAAITVLVVTIPEGLPLAVTLALAYPVKKTLADHNLVRHPHACEAMGNATTICTDKTGALTTNRMAVVWTFLCGEERGQGTSQTSLVTSRPAQARELLGQAVAYNSSYSSRLEERDGLAVQRDIEQDEEQREEDGHLHGPAPAGLQGQQQRHTAQEQQQHGPALDGGRTAENEVGANSANGGHGADDGEHSEQEDAGDTGVDAGDTGDDAGDVGEHAGEGAGDAGADAGEDTGEDAGDAGEDAGDADAGEDGEEKQKERQEGDHATDEAVIASQGWRGGRCHPPRIRKKINKY